MSNQLRILEVNVDDLNHNGVYSLVKSLIVNCPAQCSIDIANVEPFENESNVTELASYGTHVFFVGHRAKSLFAKAVKQFFVFAHIRSLVRKGKYDVVHIHSDVSNKLFIMGLAARMGGCRKLMFHSHANGVDGNNRTFKKLFHFVCKWWLRFIGTHFLTCSELAAQWMYPNINKERILMVPNGIDLSRFAHKTDVRSRVRQQLGLTTQMVIGHVGRFAYQKNHTFLLEVFAALCAQRPDVRLLLVGQGDLQEAMRTKAQTIGIEDRVIFYGVTDQPEDLFQAMDLFALPSHFEGLPIVGVEAQAAGLPCLFSSCITRQVKLNPNVDFLSIDIPNSPALWAQKMTEMMGQREEDATRNLTQAGFAIQNTVETIWKIYAN